VFLNVQDPFKVLKTSEVFQNINNYKRKYFMLYISAGYKGNRCVTNKIWKMKKKRELKSHPVST
jgi:hypothetical protein